MSLVEIISLVCHNDVANIEEYEDGRCQDGNWNIDGANRNGKIPKINSEILVKSKRKKVELHFIDQKLPFNIRLILPVCSPVAFIHSICIGTFQVENGTHLRILLDRIYDYYSH